MMIFTYDPQSVAQRLSIRTVTMTSAASKIVSEADESDDDYDSNIISLCPTDQSGSAAESEIC